MTFLATISRRCLSSAAAPDVLVVGAGPAGLVLSSLLGRFGVSVGLLEARSALPSHPQAHFVNYRTMEILRPLDGLAAEVAQETPPLKEWRRFVYREALMGKKFAEVDHFLGQRSQFSPHSPEPVAHLSQNRLLPLLLQRAQSHPSVQIQFQSDVQQCWMTSDGVKLKYVTQDGSQWEIAANYGVLANGANSQLVEKLGIRFQGTGVIQNLLSVHFHSKHLSRALLNDPAMLYFVFNVEVVMVVVAHNLSHGEFVAQIPFFPPLQGPSDFRMRHVRDLIQAAAGMDLNDIQVESVRPWVMKAQTAEVFQRGNLFLVGDAAHVFPPAGGFGMNTGIQDAHNLAWKLASVIKGRSSRDLLSTYTTERRPVVLQNSELSVENWKEAVAVPAALGLDPQHATLLSSIVSGATAFVPQSAAKAVLDLGLGLGRRLSGFKGPWKFWRQQQMKTVFNSGRSLRLQFLQEDLGFMYPLAQPSTASQSAHLSRKRRGSDVFVPRIVPGGRLPHAVLQLDSNKRLSSLDAVSWSGLQCSLFLIGFERAHCHTLLQSLSLPAPPQTLAVYLTEWSQAEANREGASPPLLELSEVEDSDLIPLSASVRLIEAVDVHQTLTGAQRGSQVIVVVRPDGHIAAILTKARAESVESAVHNAVSFKRF